MNNNEIKLRLENFKVIKGLIKCETGLHIGGTAETIEIGGLDKPIIKDSITDLPYIPGSSIKGKMRSLLEWKYGNFQENGDVHKYDEKKCKKDCPICRIFGTSAEEAKIGPARLIVRDAHLTEGSRKELEKLRQKKGLVYAEQKTENSINRLTARANPRTQERVPAGTEFEFEMVYRIFDLDDDKGVKDRELFEVVKDAIGLLQMDALGGSGSRGYGKVTFDIKENCEYRIMEKGMVKVDTNE